MAIVLATRAEFEKSDAILERMGVGCSPAFLSSCYRRASRHLIYNFARDIRKLSFGFVLALYVAFGHESFAKGPVVLFNHELADLRLVSLLTLLLMTYGHSGDIVLLRYSEQFQGSGREFEAQMESASYRKLKDWRILILQYLLQQIRSLTGEDKPVADEKVLIWPSCFGLRSEGFCHIDLRAYSDARVSCR